MRIESDFRGINYLPEAAAFRVRLTCTFNLQWGDGVPQGVEYRPPVGACSDCPASYEGGEPMKIVSISQDFFDLVEGDRETHA